jgi:hypothetical protein
MLQLKEQLAGHSKNPRAIQKVLPVELEEVIESNDFEIPAFQVVYPDKFKVDDRVVVKTFQGNPNHEELKLISGKQATVRGYAHQSYLLSFDGKPHICYWNEEDLELYTESLFIVPSINEDAPLEHGSVADDLCDRLATLEQQRDSIRNSGPIAPPNVWIEYGKCNKRKFRQAYYRSTKPIFPAKRQSSLAKSESGLVKRLYIGEENSAAVKAAGDAIARRNQLDVISREIRLIERKLEE